MKAVIIQFVYHIDLWFPLRSCDRFIYVGMDVHVLVRFLNATLMSHVHVVDDIVDVHWSTWSCYMIVDTRHVLVIDCVWMRVGTMRACVYAYVLGGATIRIVWQVYGSMRVMSLPPSERLQWMTLGPVHIIDIIQLLLARFMVSKWHYDMEYLIGHAYHTLFDTCTFSWYSCYI